jgi:hypothetical protein
MISQTLFERKVMIQDPLIIKNLALRGEFTRQQQGNFFKTSKKNYFRFFHFGEFLAQFDASPVSGLLPTAVYYTSQYSGNSDVQIDKEKYTQIDFGEFGFRVKFNDEQEKKTWANALLFFNSMHITSKTYKEVEEPENIPPVVKMLIVAELEQENWTKLKTEVDYSLFIQDKGLKGLLAEGKLLKNRLLIGKATVLSRTDRKPLPGEPEAPVKTLTRGTTLGRNSPNDPATVETGLIGSEYHLVILGQHPLVAIDQDTIRSDHAIMEEQNVPKWLECGCLHFFRYDGYGDKSESVHKVHTL